MCSFYREKVPWNEDAKGGVEYVYRNEIAGTFGQACKVCVIHPLQETVIICPSVDIVLVQANIVSGAHFLYHPSHHSLESCFARDLNYY